MREISPLYCSGPTGNPSPRRISPDVHPFLCVKAAFSFGYRKRGTTGRPEGTVVGMLGSKDSSVKACIKAVSASMSASLTNGPFR